MPAHHHHHQHVFLFRHCVRSAYRHIDLYDNNHNNNDGETSSSSHYPTDIADYLGVPLPDWQTPGEGQCTRAGLETLMGTGKFLLRDYLRQKYHHYHASAGDDDGRTQQELKKQQIFHLQIDFRADMASQRDVDSAWALQHGMIERDREITKIYFRCSLSNRPFTDFKDAPKRNTSHR
jgi:hypothetical protein